MPQDVARKLHQELKDIMDGLPAQIELTEVGDVRLMIISESLTAAIHALKPRPE